MNKFIYLLVFMLGTSFITCKEETPDLNKDIIRIVKSSIGKKIDRGECWDLAALVLNKNACQWDGLLEYGKLLNTDKDCIFPGDIIQFEKVKLKYSKGNMHYEEDMYHHTAIVYEVLGEGKFRIAHQNFGNNGRKVGLSEIDFSTVVKGKYMFYRPVKSN